MAEKKKLTKKEVKLGGLSEKVFNCLCINPTTKHVIKRTGKSKESVGRILKKLITSGHIIRLGRGHYKVNQNKQVLSQINQKLEKTTEWAQQNLPLDNFFRLHNLEIEIKIPDYQFKKIKNLLFVRKVFKNIIYNGQNHGNYFDVPGSDQRYMLTKKKVFVTFPVGWELSSETLLDLQEKLYNCIMCELELLRYRYKINCFKDGRVNFDITNMHIALPKNEIAKEFKTKKISNMVIHDEIDGKPRYIFDFSNLMNEWEAIHPEYAVNDIDEAKKFMNHTKDGITDHVLSRGKEFFNDKGDMNLSDIKKIVYDLAKIVTSLATENKETAAGLNSVVQLLKMQLPENLDPQPLDKDKPYYVG